ENGQCCGSARDRNPATWCAFRYHAFEAAVSCLLFPAFAAWRTVPACRSASAGDRKLLLPNVIGVRVPPVLHGNAPSLDDLDALSALSAPSRRRLYDHISASSTPVGRDEAAAAAGISRSLAAYHLDRLAQAGLLETTFARPAGRSGPGAGRPAKLYRRAA